MDKVDSPFSELDIDMISTFPIDPMHALDLGVMKKLLLRWKEGSHMDTRAFFQITYFVFAIMCHLS